MAVRQSPLLAHLDEFPHPGNGGESNELVAVTGLGDHRIDHRVDVHISRIRHVDFR